MSPIADARPAVRCFDTVRTVARAVLLALAGATGVAHAGDNLLARYDAASGALPEVADCWTFLGAATVPPSVEKGILRLGPTTTSGAAYWEVELPPFSFDDGAAIAARIRVVDSSFVGGTFQRTGTFLALADESGRWAYLGIASDRLLLMRADQNPGDPTIAFDSTDGFHDYELRFVGDQVEAVVDGEVLLSTSVGTGSVPNVAYAGDLSILGASTTDTTTIEIRGTAACAPGDVDCDGVVDGADVAVLLGAWTTASCRADLNRDGVVDGADLAILLGAWTG